MESPGLAYLEGWSGQGRPQGAEREWGGAAAWPCCAESCKSGPCLDPRPAAPQIPVQVSDSQRTGPGSQPSVPPASDSFPGRPPAFLDPLPPVLLPQCPPELRGRSPSIWHTFQDALSSQPPFLAPCSTTSPTLSAGVIHGGHSPQKPMDFERTGRLGGH